MVTDWETTNIHRDLPPAVWEYIKGLRLPGDDHPEGVRRTRLLRLRALAGDHQAVDTQRHRCGDGARSEFTRPRRALLNYGTDEQKRRYLPRLARGLELPCFALTSPQAGSDAA